MVLKYCRIPFVPTEYRYGGQWLQSISNPGLKHITGPNHSSSNRVGSGKLCGQLMTPAMDAWSMKPRVRLVWVWAYGNTNVLLRGTLGCTQVSQVIGERLHSALSAGPGHTGGSWPLLWGQSRAGQTGRAADTHSSSMAM